jgi:hypothetical protein
MADRNPSFFGPVLPPIEGSPPAFSDDELMLIRARRLETDILRAASPAWPDGPCRETIYPARRLSPVSLLRPADGATT